MQAKKFRLPVILSLRISWMTGLQKQYSDIFYDEKDCSIAADGINQGSNG